jgi:hypothetical protein
LTFVCGVWYAAGTMQRLMDRFTSVLVRFRGASSLGANGFLTMEEREAAMTKKKDVEQSIDRLVHAAVEARELVARIADPRSRAIGERVTEQLLERNLESALAGLFKQARKGKGKDRDKAEAPASAPNGRELVA